jgi:hypothetical protein
LEQKRGGRDLFAEDKSLRWSGEVSADQKSIPPAHRQGFVLLYCMAHMLKASIPKISKLGFIHGEMECNMTLKDVWIYMNPDFGIISSSLLEKLCSNNNMILTKVKFYLIFFFSATKTFFP